MCGLYGVTRSGYYAWKARGRSERSIVDEHLWATIERIYHASRGTYGSPRIYHELRVSGVRIGRKRVERLMRSRGIKARCARIYRSKRGLREYFTGIPNHSLDVVPTRPDQVWVGDITYLKVGNQWLYLAAVMDKFSRRIVGWSMSKSKDTTLTLQAFNQAVENRRPQPGTIFHSDRGTEYGAFIFRNRLAEIGVVQSMNRLGGKMTDNATMESFFHSLKAEGVHGVKFADGQAVSNHIRSYMPFYNSRRIHSSLGYLSPEAYECKST
jgi:putative transposase